MSTNLSMCAHTVLSSGCTLLAICLGTFHRFICFSMCERVAPVVLESFRSKFPSDILQNIPQWKFIQCNSSRFWSQFIKILAELIDLAPKTQRGAGPAQEISLCSWLFIHEQTQNKDKHSARFVLVCAFSWMNKQTKETPFLFFWVQMGTCSCHGSRTWALTAVFECCQEIRRLLNAQRKPGRSGEATAAGAAPARVRNCNPCRSEPRRASLQVNVAQVGGQRLVEHWNIIDLACIGVCGGGYFQGCIGLSSVSVCWCVGGRLSQCVWCTCVKRYWQIMIVGYFFSHVGAMWVRIGWPQTRTQSTFTQVLRWCTVLKYLNFISMCCFQLHNIHKTTC